MRTVIFFLGKNEMLIFRYTVVYNFETYNKHKHSLPTYYKLKRVIWTVKHFPSILAN